MTRSEPRRIVIIGGGFAGVACAQTLRRQLHPADWEIVVFNPENHMIFHPLLAEVVGSSINPVAAAPPLRQLLRGVSVRRDAVSSVDLSARRLTFGQVDGREGQLGFEHVVFACGRAVNLGLVPGMADHAFPLKTIGDALALRAHVIECLERADSCPDPMQQRWLAQVIVVGGGFSGVEVAGELNDLIRESRRFYPRIPADAPRVTLVHSGDQILPELGKGLRASAARHMQRTGIEFALNASASAITSEGVVLRDGRVLYGATVVSAIGTTATSLVERLDAQKVKGALATTGDLRLVGCTWAWAAGDCAHIVNAADGDRCPPTGQFAQRQGKAVAENIVASIQGTERKAFAFAPLGQLCAIGRHHAVASILGLNLSGILAWFIWRTVYLLKLPSWSRRVKVGSDWAWDLLFPRDLVSLKANQTERVGQAFLRKGDYVFRAGDPALNFYAVQEGEVEVVRESASGGDEEVVAVLGKGDFFGEMALLEQRMRSASVRARSDAEVAVLGANVFTRLTSALAPLRRTVVDTARRRSLDLSRRLPEAVAVLDGTPLSDVIEPLPDAVPPETLFRDALSRMSQQRLEMLYVADSANRLVGVVTRSDLLRAVDKAFALSFTERRQLTVGDVMTPDPVAVTAQDSTRTAAAILWGRGLKVIPVTSDSEHRWLLGCIRVERVLSCSIDGLTALHTG
ncbi:MAG: FAD-dependent oxidoreductase [Gemmatimonadaceae bacterium]